MGEDHVFQHYVPKFYFRNFIDSNETLHCIRASSDDPNVNESNTFPINAGEGADIGIAASDEFYDATIEKKFEKGLANFENIWANSIRELLTQTSLDYLSEEEKDDLLIFVVVQYIRTRETREQLTKGMGELAEEADDEELVGFAKSCLKNEGRDAHMAIMNVVTELLFDRLREHGRFHLYENNSDTPFITSDNPVVQYSQNKPNKFDYRDAIGVGGTDWEIYIPLDPDYCLAVRCIHKFGEEIGKSVVYDEFVKAHNKLQLVNATEVAVCNNGAYDGVRESWNKLKH